MTGRCAHCDRPTALGGKYCSNDCQFEANLAMGRRGEAFVAEQFRRAGFWVSITAERMARPGEGPRLRNAQNSLITPDIQVIQHGLTAWLQVKTKTSPTWGRLTKKWEHGCELNSWEECLAWQRELNDAVFLVFVELSFEGVIQMTMRGIWIDHIKLRGDCPTLFDAELMVYLLRERLWEGPKLIAHVKRYFEHRRRRGDGWRDA